MPFHLGKNRGIQNKKLKIFFFGELKNEERS